MNNYGFVKVACIVPKIKVANPDFNADEIISALNDADKNGATVSVTPELSLCGYTCGDLLLKSSLLKSCERALLKIVKCSEKIGALIAVGAPLLINNNLYNTCVFIHNGKILGAVPKQYISTAEKRWFAEYDGESVYDVTLCGNSFSVGNMLVGIGDGIKIACELSDDLFAPIPSSTAAALNGANIILNLSATREQVSKSDFIKELIKVHSVGCICGYAYCSSGVYESTTDNVYAGRSMICENGTVISENEPFVRRTQITYGIIDTEKLNNLRLKNKLFSDGCKYYECDFENISATVLPMELSFFDRSISPTPFIPDDPLELRKRCNEILNIQAAGLSKRMEHIGSKKCVVGISGGLDSTLALLVAVKAADITDGKRSDIIAITMPGFGTTDRTKGNAYGLMEALGVTIKEISIKDACIGHFKDIGHDMQRHDVTYENTQARERTQILMDISNKENAILVGTGDLSELALGFCTYNGDHMSMYGVNAGVPKTMLRHMIKSIAETENEAISKILFDILDTPVSPELLPPDNDGKIMQKTEEKIGVYELHDFFLYYFIRFGFGREKILFLAEKAFLGKYDTATIKNTLELFMKRFFAMQFKRSCLPDGPSVGTVGLSPRGELYMPSDADGSVF